MSTWYKLKHTQCDTFPLLVYADETAGKCDNRTGGIVVAEAAAAQRIVGARVVVVAEISTL